jgi:hypothetical protein
MKVPNWANIPIAECDLSGLGSLPPRVKLKPEFSDKALGKQWLYRRLLQIMLENNKAG